ncbi:MAG TPA: kelch repeat-containing protein [bacterium]|nr:kelch repeat-containing protein [bacterium]
MNDRILFAGLLAALAAIFTLFACAGDDDDDNDNDDSLDDDDNDDADDDAIDDDDADDHPWSGPGQWAARTPMPTARSSMAVAVAGGLVYVMGGANIAISPDRYLDSVDVYDPLADSWQAGVALPEARLGAAVGVIDERIYLAGGYAYTPSASRYLNRLDMFDPQTGEWTALSPMPTARSLAAGVVSDGMFYVLAGRNDEGKSMQTLAVVERYDPATDEWTSLPSLAVAREASAATTAGNAILLGGGWTGTITGYLAAVLIYDPLTGETSATDLSEPRCSLAAATLWNRYAVFAGGYLDAWPPFREAVDVFDATNAQWLAIADLPDGRGGLGLVVADGRLFALGGGDYDEETQTAWAPTADVWEFVPD